MQISGKALRCFEITVLSDSVVILLGATPQVQHRRMFSFCPVLQPTVGLMYTYDIDESGSAARMSPPLGTF